MIIVQPVPQIIVITSDDDLNINGIYFRKETNNGFYKWVSNGNKEISKDKIGWKIIDESKTIKCKNKNWKSDMLIPFKNWQKPDGGPAVSLNFIQLKSKTNVEISDNYSKLWPTCWDIIEAYEKSSPQSSPQSSGSPPTF